MTVVVGIHGGDFVLVGADGRSVSYDDAGAIATIDDDYEKVRKTAFGVVAAAGNIALAQLVNLKLAFPDVTTAAVGSTISEEIDVVNQHDQEIGAGAVAMTVWMMSARTAEGLRLWTTRASDPQSNESVEAQSFALIAPHGMSDAAEVALRHDISQRLKALHEAELPLGQRIETAAKVIQAAVACAGHHCQTVGPRFQFGLHLNNGQAKLSDLTATVDATKWRYGSLCEIQA